MSDTIQNIKFLFTRYDLCRIYSALGSHVNWGAIVDWLISRCLLGDACRYDGKSKPCEVVGKLAQKLTFTGVCPEVSGGMSTPRIPSEYDGCKVVNAQGFSVDDAYRLGAKTTVDLAKGKTTCCILKEKSPSCGSEYRYDGTFASHLVEGEGVTAEALYNAGVVALSEVVVADVLEEMHAGFTIVYRFENIRPALARLYTQDIQRACCGCNLQDMDVVVLGSDECIPDDKPAVVIDIKSSCINAVFAPSSADVRKSHQLKKQYLLACLVSEALSITDMQYDAYKQQKPGKLSCHVQYHMSSMAYQDIVQKLANLASSLHEFLYIE